MPAVTPRHHAADAARRLGVAFDATTLLGRPTGVGAFCQGALHALSERPDVALHAFVMSWRRRDAIANELPAGVASGQRPMPAGVLHALWRHAALPPYEWFGPKVDVVHGTNFVVPPTTSSAQVVSVHDLTPLRYPEFTDGAARGYPELIRRAVGRGAWVHTDSAFVAEEVVEAFAVPPDRVRVVAPGIPPLPVLDVAAARQVVAPMLASGTDRYVLAVGTAEPRKDLPGLVRAFDELAALIPDVALVLAGPPGWGEESLVAAIAAAHARHRIVRTGWVDEDTLAALFAAAAVVAYPSIYEGFGFPPLQAMASGVPVVATRAGSVPEVLGAAALLVDVGDTAALAAALQQALTDESVRARLIAAGQDRADSFSWSRCAEGLADLYRLASAARR
jgi:glycosyltransferase involved in cell wall biosynthesis